MKVAKSTKARISAIKAEAGELKAKMDNLAARLEEHSGTKRITRGLKDVIERLERWQSTPHS